MTDHEQLALAAKAAGKTRADWDYAWLAARGAGMARDILWDPRRDSGHALELAAHLGLNISPSALDEEVDAWVADEPDQNATETWEEHQGNKAAAWRMAIFRAAVAIGATLP